LKGQSIMEPVTVVLTILILIFARGAWLAYLKGPPQAYRPIADEQRRRREEFANAPRYCVWDRDFGAAIRADRISRSKT
jgi:hypothetical protein